MARHDRTCAASNSATWRRSMSRCSGECFQPPGDGSRSRRSSRDLKSNRSTRVTCSTHARPAQASLDEIFPALTVVVGIRIARISNRHGRARTRGSAPYRRDACGRDSSLLFQLIEGEENRVNRALRQQTNVDTDVLDGVNVPTGCDPVDRIGVFTCQPPPF